MIFFLHNYHYIPLTHYQCEIMVYILVIITSLECETISGRTVTETAFFQILWDTETTVYPSCWMVSFSNINGHSHLTHWHLSTFVDGKRNSQSVLIVVLGPSLHMHNAEAAAVAADSSLNRIAGRPDWVTDNQTPQPTSCHDPPMQTSVKGEGKGVRGG